MARNAVQLQKELSEPAFEQQYGTEEQCQAVVVAVRWSDEFWCPACGGREHSTVATRDLSQCTTCRRQTSPIAGTIFASTKLPLRTWFRAMYHLTQSKQGISSVELGRRLGVTQTTAWKVRYKLAQVILERNAAKPLTVAAVEQMPQGKPVRPKLGQVTSFCETSVAGFAKHSLDPDCTVVSDGLQCFGSVTDAGCDHQAIKTGSGSAAARTLAFRWVNTALGNTKAAITGTYRAISSRYVPRYLAEFDHRFNQRYDLAATIPRLCWAGVRTASMPYQLLKLAERVGAVCLEDVESEAAQAREHVGVGADARTVSSPQVT